jgi:HAD superfamily hydrolase (TIGR01509 family)
MTAISTLIFDLDGLLSDTERLHRRAYQEALRFFGVELPDEQYDEHWVRNGLGIREFADRHGLDLDPTEVRPLKAARYRELVRAQAQPMRGALAALNTLRHHKTLALATASEKPDAYTVIETLGIAEVFSCIATKANAARVKPAPDIYLWVASELQVDPSECLVLEDSERGVAAAHAAGMRSIAIPNDQTRGNDFSKATMRLPSLEDLTLEAIEEANQQPLCRGVACVPGRRLR